MEKKIIDYIIVKDTEVMTYINKGYVLYGNPISMTRIDTHFKQALIKYEE